jgi:formate dehydrogenase beta subunit
MPAEEEEVMDLLAEGNVLLELASPRRIVTRADRVVALECVRNELGAPDADGRRRPVPIKDSNFIILCDAVVPAVGQVCVVDCVLPEEEALTPWKTLVVDEVTFQSKQKNVFGGGDCVTGPDTLIAALAAGKNAAWFIHRYLETGECRPRVKDHLQDAIGQMPLFDAEEVFDYPGITRRQHATILSPDDRIADFREVEKGLTESQAIREADRCLRCYRIVMAAT